MLASAMSLIKRAGSIGLGVLRAGAAPPMGSHAGRSVTLAVAAASRPARPLALAGEPMRLQVATRLSQRTVATAAAVGGASNVTTVSKAKLEVRFLTKVGQEAVVRRAQSGDEEALQGFLDRCDVFRRDHKAASPGLARDPDEHIRMAASPRHDTLVAVVLGRIVGMAITNPQGGDGERPVDTDLLEVQGLAARKVCVSHLMVEPQLRGQGIGKVLKQAQVRGAGDAGYEAVVGHTASATMKALAERIGGQFQGEGTVGLTVVRTGRGEKED